MNIGEQIKIKRTEKKISQEKLAELCGLKGRSIIFDYESGRINPSMKVLAKMAEIFESEIEFRFIDKK